MKKTWCKVTRFRFQAVSNYCKRLQTVAECCVVFRLGTWNQKPDVSPIFDIMNFLAHAWLSGDNPMVMAANVTGDAFKGLVSEKFPLHFRAGLQLHRHIDRYTDTHLELKKASVLLKPYYGRYSGVALDVWLDHILASEFRLHHKHELRHFTNEVYHILNAHREFLNEEANGVARFMIEHDWLYQYASKNYIENVMARMATRFKAPALVNGGHPAKDTIDEIRLIFNSLSVEILSESDKKLNELLNL